MGYEKMTLESFLVNLKEGKYKDLTGSRRAIGKAAWPDADKQKAQGAALKHFGGEPAKAAKAPAAKKTAKKAPAKRRGALVVQGTGGKSNGIAHNTAHAHAPVKQPKKISVPPPPALPRQLGAPGSPSMETATRQNSAAMVISSLANRPLSTLEERAYAMALGEMCAATSGEGQSLAHQLLSVGGSQNGGQEPVPARARRATGSTGQNPPAPAPVQALGEEDAAEAEEETPPTDEQDPTPIEDDVAASLTASSTESEPAAPRLNLKNFIPRQV